MDWWEDYEECEITVDIQCQDITEDAWNALISAQNIQSNFSKAESKMNIQSYHNIIRKPRITPVTSVNKPVQIVSPVPKTQPIPPKTNQSQTPKKTQNINTAKKNVTSNTSKLKIRSKPASFVRLTLRSPQLLQRFKRVIQNVPGRQDQALQIFNFVINGQSGSSSPLCIQGNTGCGKTSLMTKILSFFEENSPAVSVAYINCISMRTTNLLYVNLLERFYPDRRIGKAGRRGRAAQGLKECIQQQRRKGDERTKIIVLDEIDYVFKEERFMYNMLQWLGAGSVIIVLISNIIGFITKLPPKLVSRAKFSNIIFEPYQHQALQKIFYYKYPEIRKLCKRQTVSYISKRIYNINSDIRTLNKIYHRIQQRYKQINADRPLEIIDISDLIYEKMETLVLQNSYAVLLKILCAQKSHEKIDVSREIIQKLFFEGKRMPRKEEILWILRDLQQMDLITFNTTQRTHLVYDDFYIRINDRDRLTRYLQELEK